MKQFLRLISPRRAIADFATVWHQPTEHRWGVLGIAAALTFALFMLFIPESQRIAPAPPEVIYISTFEESRTEREIIASNCRNQELKDQLEARLAERAELRRDLYKALGRATFLDVDEMEAEAERARAEEQAAAATGQAATATNPAAAITVEEYCAQALG